MHPFEMVDSGSVSSDNCWSWAPQYRAAQAMRSDAIMARLCAAACPLHATQVNGRRFSLLPSFAISDSAAPATVQLSSNRRLPYLPPPRRSSSRFLLFRHPTSDCRRPSFARLPSLAVAAPTTSRAPRARSALPPLRLVAIPPCHGEPPLLASPSPQPAHRTLAVDSAIWPRRMPPRG